MASNKKKEKDSSKLILFNPNPCNGEVIPTEDLSILVDLTATRRGRSVISLDAVTGEDDLINNSTKKSETIGFIDGTNVGGGKRALTTNYLEANTTFTQGGENDLESLGIESINIDFDTAYTPIVKIKFIDIRGHSIFQQGIDSKYKMFFELPYPIFNLTVKGFFGQAVKYCLHLTKWNSSFNSQTGNFEIDAEFIGYTYALLTDLLMGYIRASVHTEVGKEIFKGYQEEWAAGNKVLKSIDDMLQDIQKLGDEFDKIKQEDGSLKLLDNSEKINDVIKRVESDLTGVVNTIVPDKTDFFNNRQGVLATSTKQAENKTVINTIASYKKRIKEELTDEKLNKDITNEDLKLNSEELVEIVEITLLQGKDLNIIDDAVTAVFDKAKKKGGGYDKADEIDPDSPDYKYVHKLMEQVIKNMPRGFASSNPETKIVIYDMRKPYQELNRTKKNLDDNDKDVRLALGEKLAKIAKEQLDFDPTIHNIFSVLTVHCEVFLKTISAVSKTAEKNKTREKALTTLSKDGLNYKNGSSFFAWPEFKHRKNEHDGFIETWLGGGEGLGSKANDVDEVVFIEDLLACLMQLVQNDDELLATEDGSRGPQYWPVSPLDVAIRNDSQILQNPYAEALKTIKSKGTPDEATRLLIMRGFLGLGLANETLAEINVGFMGKMEAENLFDVVSKMEKTVATNLINGINNQFEGTGSQKAKELTDQWMKGVSSTVNNPFGLQIPLMVIDSGSTTNYVYSYIGDKGTKRWYIPISSGFDGQDFYDGQEGLKSYQDLSLLSSEILFTGSHINNTSNALPKDVSSIWDVRGLTGTTGEQQYPDDGAIYLKIMSESAYKQSTLSPTYGNETLTEGWRPTIPLDSLISQNSLHKATYEDGEILDIDPYSGRYKTQEIINIIYDGGNADSFNEGIHFKMGGDEQVSSVLCTYWNQVPKVLKSRLGGNYLSRTNFKNRGDVYDMDFENPQKDIKTLWSTFNIGRIVPDDFGKQKELIGHLLGLVPEPKEEDIHIPYIEFSIATNEDEATSHFSLFGSQFYYEQSPEGKALLFLHTFGWNGCIGDIGDMLTKADTIDVSLFDSYQQDDTTFGDEDDTFTLKSLFNTNGSFIKAPRLWCAFIGGLLYRLDTSLENSNNEVIKYRDNLFPWQDELSAVPYFWEYLYDSRSQSQFGMTFVFDGANVPGASGDLVRNDFRQTPEELLAQIFATWSPLTFLDDATNPSRSNYPVVDRGLLGLPQQVRKEFKKVFTSFVTDFNSNLAPQLEIVDNYNLADWKTKWDSLDSKVVVDPQLNKRTIKTQDVIDVFISGATSPSSQVKLKSAIKNYNNISVVSDGRWIKKTGKAYVFNLELRPDSDAVRIMKEYIKDTYVIANGTPVLFRTNEARQDNKIHNRNIEVPKSKMDSYLSEFYTRFEKLSENWTANQVDSEDEIQSRIFNSIDDDMIKLNLYRSVASIYNKWVAGTDDPLVNGCAGNIGTNKVNKEAALHDRNSEKPHFIDSFRFLDRSFNNIGNEFYLNPLDIFNKIVGNYNQSFFDVANATLIKNNFNFIALPTFLNFNDPKQMKDMFTPYTYKDVAGGSFAAGPSFVCVYVGQTSTNLDLGTDSDYPDDGITIEADCDGNNITNAPEDFIAERSKDGSLNIPLFMVKYGQQNQSFFKDIKLDQREFAETAESLQIIEDISQQGDSRKPNFNGQNLFNVYQTRSYSAEVEMMGNAMIQPMMYFQLDNIPMFRGAYLIIKVSHTINAHQMTTKFKGTRVKRTKTPLIDKATLFMSLLGSLESLGESRVIGGGPGSGVRKTNAQIDQVARWIDTPMDIKLTPVKLIGATGEKAKKEQGFVMQQIGDDHRWAIREVVEVLQTVFQEFHNNSVKEDYNDVVFVGDLSIMNGGISESHSSHQIGRDVDFRQIVSKKEETSQTTIPGTFFATNSLACKSGEVGCTSDNGLVFYKKASPSTGSIKLWDPVGDTRDSIGDYSRAGTRALIKLLLEYTDPANGKNTKTINGKIITFPEIENIWFNDTVLAEEFPVVSVLENHTHHLHVKFQIPKRVLTENADGTKPGGENTRRFSS